MRRPRAVAAHHPPAVTRAGRRALALALALAGCSNYFSPTPTPRRDAGPDANPDAAPAVHGCDPARFVDRRDPAAERVVTFGGAVGMAFSPPCMTIAPGQAVRFVGPMALHPLRAGVVGVAGSGAASPIGDTSAGDEVTVSFPAAGEFAFHCGVHGAMGMAGVVRVR